ncbi:hypothetical protein FXW78_20550 [Rhodococcus opacus]|nr:hypothetical protein [Rhodococcus opacus]
MRRQMVAPGYINGNIHLLDGIMMMGIGGVEYLSRYEGSFVKVIEEGAQLTLRNGVTTVFDTWDARNPVLEARIGSTQVQRSVPGSSRPGTS